MITQQHAIRPTRRPFVIALFSDVAVGISGVTLVVPAVALGGVQVVVGAVAVATSLGSSVVALVASVVASSIL